MTSQSRSCRRDRFYRLGCAAILWTALALAGGASRADEWQQLAVRLAAVLTIATALWPMNWGPVRAQRGLLAGAALAWIMLLIQLIPLPPQLWAALPGHAPYARIAEQSGHVVWRPLSLAPDLTLNSLLALLPATASLLVTVNLDGRERRHVAAAIVVIAAASALLGLAQLGAGGTGLHLYRQSSADAPVGLFANRNHQAALLACALPLLGALAGTALRKGADFRIVLWGTSALGMLMLLALVSTGSRAGLGLAVIGVSGGIVGFRAAGIRLRPDRKQRIAMTGGAVLLLAFTALGAWRSEAMHRLARTDAVEETRLQILAPLIETARAFMPWGSGFGSFDRAYRRFEPDGLLSTIHLNAAHNELLQIAIEGGVPALLLLALFLFWWSKTALRLIREQVPARRKGMRAAAMAVTLILMASSLVDYPLRTPLLGALFVFACLEMARAAGQDRPGAADGGA